MSFLTEFLSWLYVSFIVVLLFSFVSCCTLNLLLFNSLLFCHCFSCDLCFWYLLLLYSLLLFSGYKWFCEVFLYSSAFHLSYLFVSFIAVAARFYLRKCHSSLLFVAISIKFYCASFYFAILLHYLSYFCFV